MNTKDIIKILLNPPKDDAPVEDWKIYREALAEAERQVEAPAERIHELLAA